MTPATRGTSRRSLPNACRSPHENAVGQLWPQLANHAKPAQAPFDLIDYVIVHELCHLKEHNHSKRYYGLLNAALPAWRERRQRLSGYKFI